MGLSVANQVDEKQYFSLSSISKNRMRELGFKITMKELKEKARKAPPIAVIYTGDVHIKSKRKQVNIWRYEDFI